MKLNKVLNISSIVLATAWLLFVILSIVGCGDSNATTVDESELLDITSIDALVNEIKTYTKEYQAVVSSNFDTYHASERSQNDLTARSVSNERAHNKLIEKCNRACISYELSSRSMFKLEYEATLEQNRRVYSAKRVKLLNAWNFERDEATATFERGNRTRDDVVTRDRAIRAAYQKRYATEKTNYRELSKSNNEAFELLKQKNKALYDKVKTLAPLRKGLYQTYLDTNQ